ncbi:MAG: aminoglycoside phosphotransferase family protein [Pseudomonadota bacterium]
MNDRTTLIRGWLSEEIGITFNAITPASSDASFRRYLRIHTQDGTRIVMDAPPEHEDIRPFVRIAHILESRKIHVPHIYACCEVRGLMLLEDLGHKSYLSELTPNTANALYGKSINTLCQIQACPTDSLPIYDSTLLMREMRLFEEWFIEHHLGISLSANEKTLLNEVYENLTKRALGQNKAFVHRDFHSRNLMQTANNSPGVIDFQDAVVGPITYDLISMLRDSYIEWPESDVIRWARQFHELLVDQASPAPAWDRFWDDFNWMSAQRHLKVLGIFARLHHRDGKSGYLKDIPLTLKNLRKALQPYPEFNTFMAWLELRLENTDYRP